MRDAVLQTGTTIRTLTSGRPNCLVVIWIHRYCPSRISFSLLSDERRVGISGDSVRYVMGAENLVAGRGYSRTIGDGTTTPIKGFPPLYSIVLAATIMIGFNPFEGARLINAVLYAGSIVLTSFLVLRATRSPAAGLAAGFMVIAISQVLRTHTWAMTEPLYIFLSLLVFLLLDSYLENGRRTGFFSLLLRSGWLQLPGWLV